MPKSNDVLSESSRGDILKGKVILFAPLPIVDKSSREAIAPLCKPKGNYNDEFHKLANTAVLEVRLPRCHCQARGHDSRPCH